MPALVQCHVTGARHEREGKSCQDAVHSHKNGDVVAIAVADGHGTSARGEVGAKFAVHVAVDQLLQFPDKLRSDKSANIKDVHACAEEMRAPLVREWSERVRRDAGTESPDLQLYGSTLLFALATPGYLIVGQIGDGDVLLVDSAGRVERPIDPDPSNFADETASLCQSKAWEAIRLSTRHPPGPETLLLLSTDGYSKSYATDADYEKIGPDYLDLFRKHGAEGVQSLLPGFLKEVSSKGSGDDIALGMLYWPASAGPVAGAKPTADVSGSDKAGDAGSPSPAGDRPGGE